MNNNKLGFGIFLVFIGVVLILMNLGIIGWSIWNSIFTLWPLLLVAAGVNIVFRQNQIVKLITWFVILVILIVHSYYNPTSGRFHFDGFRTPFVRSYIETENVTLEKPNETKKGTLELDVGALSFDVGSTGSGLVEAKINKDLMSHNVNYSNNKETAEVSFKTDINYIAGRNIQHEASFLLNDSMEWQLDIDMGAAKSDLDLSGLKISKIDIDCGAASLDLKLGNKNDNTDVVINSGVSEIRIDVPKDAGIKFISEGALKDIDFNGINFTKDGKTYTTDNYNTAACKIYISTSMGLGKIDVYGY